MTHPVLDLPMGDNDADAKTVREYFQELLKVLINEGEGFSGKRPFGNSGWEYELYKPLIVGGVVKGTLDEDGFIDTFDEKKARTVLLKAIADL